jgi:hypothetical protein
MTKGAATAQQIEYVERAKDYIEEASAKSSSSSLRIFRLPDARQFSHPKFPS